MNKKGTLHIGTSGWHYKHWVGSFYPPETKEEHQLQAYAQYFKTVEINNSFYKLPTSKTFKKWAEETPSDFTFAVKASRFITHMKKLNVLKADIDTFLRRVDWLDNKTGPILFQLPPQWKINTDRLSLVLSRLNPNYRYTFEFRNNTWYTEDVYNLLKQYNCSFCIYELAGHVSPMPEISDFRYIRLHGPGDKYQGLYNTQTLKKWATRCRHWTKAGNDVYIYFDNDQAGYAAKNATRLQQLTK